MSSSHSENAVLDDELTAVAGRVLPLVEQLSSDQLYAVLAYVTSARACTPVAPHDAILCPKHAALDSEMAQVDGASRRLLNLTLLCSAIAGGLVVLAAALWVAEAKEGFVLFVLFMATIFYVLAETAFGERLLARGADTPVLGE